MPVQALQSPAVLSAARDFARRVALTWPMQSAMLFGSQARGNSRIGSDTDVAVLLRGAPGDFVATKLALDDVAYDVLLDSGIRIQPLPIWEGEWAHPEQYSNPRLLENIAREGLAL
ncbi:nucleotidyltransferase domain-containing protein [Rhodoferax sp. TBRC 17660]|uniref:Nucleotidyltransferase domain-containing protein n=1 Tax=Rhodoferax potami TaxID=3068338 RepID=A0ABU3KJJ2_9BURK|nr:nucleotidyltransferase domain-containing protein [Rhodoferax sp. TBRC 17660]MDT7517850.1 nucleotidyltransferase domain-containing protein [Rhodoferax sp. TBRC 17660]